MSNYEPLLANIRRYVSLTETEADRLTAIVKTSRVRKRQYIIQPGFVSQYRTYLLKGMIRVFYLDQDGKEHTVSIDFDSFYGDDSREIPCRQSSLSNKMVSYPLPNQKVEVIGTGWRPQ
jgi:CRP-like cAMP-binding protein